MIKALRFRNGKSARTKRSRARRVAIATRQPIRIRRPRGICKTPTKMRAPTNRYAQRSSTT